MYRLTGACLKCKTLTTHSDQNFFFLFFSFKFLLRDVKLHLHYSATYCCNVVDFKYQYILGLSDHKTIEMQIFFSFLNIVLKVDFFFFDVTM